MLSEPTDAPVVCAVLLLVSVEYGLWYKELNVLLCRIGVNVQALTLQLVNPALRALAVCRGAGQEALESLESAAGSACSSL